MVLLIDDDKILVKFYVRDIIGVDSLVCVNCVVLVLFFMFLCLRYFYVEVMVKSSLKFFKIV
jgi:hypothetical protein